MQSCKNAKMRWFTSIIPLTEPKSVSDLKGSTSPSPECHSRKLGVLLYPSSRDWSQQGLIPSWDIWRYRIGIGRNRILSILRIPRKMFLAYCCSREMYIVCFCFSNTLQAQLFNVYFFPFLSTNPILTHVNNKRKWQNKQCFFPFSVQQNTSVTVIFIMWEFSEYSLVDLT